VLGYGGAGKAGNMENVQIQDLARLDEILEALSQESEAPCELLREHLESARVSLVGAMPAEYALNLEMAGQALNCVSNHNLRARIEDFIRGACAIQEGRSHAGKEDA
jgi:hypothetical protein